MLNKVWISFIFNYIACNLRPKQQLKYKFMDNNKKIQNRNTPKSSVITAVKGNSSTSSSLNFSFDIQHCHSTHLILFIDTSCCMCFVFSNIMDLQKRQNINLRKYCQHKMVQNIWDYIINILSNNISAMNKTLFIHKSALWCSKLKTDTKMEVMVATFGSRLCRHVAYFGSH